MSELTTNGVGKESSERRAPTFEPVSATVPLRGGGMEQALAYRLTSGEFLLGSEGIEGLEEIEGLDIQPEERVIIYFRSAGYIFRIEPDGSIKRLDLEALKTGEVVIDKPGYVSNVRAQIGVPLSGSVAMNLGTNVKGDYTVNKWTKLELSKTPVTEVLLRTSRIVPKGNELPITDTPARFGTPRQFAGR